MIINNRLAIWIIGNLGNDDFDRWLLKGIAFDGDYGFGNEDTRSYRGKSAIISLTKKKIVETVIHTAHSTRISAPLWSLEISNFPAEIPEPPFLLTDITDLNIVLDDLVELQLSEEAQKIFKRDKVGDIYPVSTSFWFGILKLKQMNNFGLTLFIPNDASHLLSKEEIIFSEWDIPVGYLRSWGK